MAKTPSKEILNRVKKRQKEDVKENITFRLKSDLLTQFRDRCEKENVSMTSIIEELIIDFLK